MLCHTIAMSCDTVVSTIQCSGQLSTDDSVVAIITVGVGKWMLDGIESSVSLQFS